MNIRELSGPVATFVDPQSLIVVSHGHRTAVATDAVKSWECDVLAQSAPVTSCRNAQEQTRAVAAQTELARYVKAVHAASEQAKAPLNQIRSKIIALDKELVAKAEAEGQRIGGLIAEYQIAEQNRVAAARRLQEAQTSKTVQEMDQKLSEAGSLDEQDQIRDQYREQLAAESPLVEPIRVAGQVVKTQWSVEVTDIHTLYRCHPNCCKLTPLLNEIKFLLDQGVSVKGVRAEKVTVSSVRLAPTPTAIEV